MTINTIPSLIFHIGPHKTGTTSLQHYLETNRDQLLAGGFAVPRIRSLDNTPNHWYLIYVACHDNERVATYHNSIRGQHGPAKCAEIREKFSKRLHDELSRICQLQPQGRYQALLSTEEVAFLRKNDWDNLYRFFLEYADRVEMIYYLRSPIDRLRSDMQQGAKGGNVLKPSLFTELPNQDLFRVGAMEPANDLRERIRLRVRPYRERQGQERWDVVADFLAVIGAPPPAAEEAQFGFNPSMSLEMFSVIQDINRVMPAMSPDGEYNRLRHHLHDAIEAYRWTPEDHPFSFSHQDVEQLRERQERGLEAFLRFCQQAAWIEVDENCQHVHAASDNLRVLDIPGSALEYKPELSRAYYVNLISHFWSYLRRIDIRAKNKERSPAMSPPQARRSA